MRAVAVAEVPRGRVVRCWRCVSEDRNAAAWLPVEQAPMGLCAKHFAAYEKARKDELTRLCLELSRYSDETGDERGRLRAARLTQEEIRAAKGDWGWLREPLDPEGFDYAAFKAWRESRNLPESQNPRIQESKEEEDDPLAF